jgi:preprotein translocase subunit SecE
MGGPGRTRTDQEQAMSADEREDERAPSRPSSDGRRDRTSARQFLREVRAELRKVAWPSRKEIASYTVVVLVTTVVLGAIVYGMDEGIRRVIITTLG